MLQKNLKSAPVVDEKGSLLGILSTSNMIEGFMGKWDSSVLQKAHTPIENVIDTLDANTLYLEEGLHYITGDIHIASLRGESAKKLIAKGDVVVVGGDREDALQAMIEAQVSLVILTGSLSMDHDLLEKFKQNSISVISTNYNTFVTSQQIMQAIPVEYVMQKDNLYTFTTDDTIDHVKNVMKETRFRSYPVLDLNGRCLGSVSRFALLNGGLKKKVIQVDHNERGQAVLGIDEAEILEIIDHHRVADIQTAGPLYYRGEPLGSTATIVTKCFREQGVEIPQNIAGILLGALLSDTLIFKSPTCTKQDIEIAKDLAKIANVHIHKFGMEMFKAGTSLVGKTIEQIFNQDYKKFTFKNDCVGVAQVSTLDIEGFMPYKDEMLQYMDEKAKTDNLSFTLLLLTDVINGNSEIFVGGERTDIVASAFHVTLENNQATLEGIISRKKQVIPAITAAIE